MVRILFVCSGNICRSPTAEGVFCHYAIRAGHAESIQFDSVGLGGWHVGDAPDPRAVAAAALRGFDIADLRARKFIQADFADFDLILAMDRGHYRDLMRRAPKEHAEKVHMYMEAAASGGGLEPDVPDPYYGETDGFEATLDMIEEGARAWLKKMEGRWI